MKTCVLDIEVTDLKPDFGRLICAVIKEYGTRRESVVYKPKNYLDDKKTMIDIRDRLNDFQIWVGHYHRRFDLPWITAKLWANKEQRMKTRWVFDTWQVLKSNMNPISRKSLANVADILLLPDQKMHIYRNEWNGARDGNTLFIDKIVERCLSDVEITEQVYNSLLDTDNLPKNLPRF